jgi:DNA (cytosine-5)-methyltransferase 1
MRTVDLFAGCGGMSLGFQNAGFNIVAAYENWEPALIVYKENFNHPIIDLDLSFTHEVSDHIKQFKPEVIIGGPPCQDFSIAGNGKEGKRANLTYIFTEIITAIMPQYFVLENVYNIQKSSVLPKAIQLLKSHNYGLSSRVLDASFLGVPQMRKRYFLIGKINSNDGFLDEYLDGDHTQKPMTIHDYFNTSLGLDYYYAHPRTYKRRAVFSVHEPSATIRRVNRPIPPNYKKHPADKSEITESVRPLTTLERAKIQTFPETFKFTGSKSRIEQLIGNAVPVKMAEHVAKCIVKDVEFCSL